MNYNYTQPDGGRVVQSLKSPSHYAHPQTPRSKTYNASKGIGQTYGPPKKWRNIHGDQSYNFKDGYYDVSTEDGYNQHRDQRNAYIEQLKAQKAAAQVPLAELPGGHHNLHPTPRYRNGVPYNERQPGMATGQQRYQYTTPIAMSTKSPQQRRKYAEGRDAYDRKYKQGKYN